MGNGGGYKERAMKRILRQSLAALSLGASSIGAAHAVMITQWNYYNESGFSAYSGASASGNSGALLGLPTVLAWGSEAQNSSLVSAGNIAGIADTNGGFVPGVPLTHNNFPIPLDISLETATMRDALTLQPIAPDPPFGGGPALEAPTLEFEIRFIETENDPASGICADGSASADGINTGGCRDIFVLTNPEELQPVVLVIDDYQYTITIGAVGLVPLSAEACAAAGAAAGCIGFQTQEGVANTLAPFFQIAAIQIVEPSMLGLLAAALGSVVWVRRRKS